MIAKTVQAAMWFIGVGVTIMFALCMLEIFYGNGLTHPMWDQNYDWMPLFRRVAYVSAIGGITLGMLNPKRTHDEDNDNYIGGHYVFHK